MRKILIIISVFLLAILVFVSYFFLIVPDNYEEIECHTPNVGKGNNKVEGIVLHHTATLLTKSSLEGLTNKNSKRSCHVLIAYDGTRYILAQPNEITYHAGASCLNGKKWCNNFTVGIEFQGSTNVFPLTGRQIASAIEYMRPIIEKYNIPNENIVTHKTIRDNYKRLFPSSKEYDKIDISDKDYERVINELKKIN